jgi:hypothetical protein
VSTVFKRFNIWSDQGGYLTPEVEPSAEGDWVKAQDAYDKVAVLEAQIQILKDQLKTARAEAKSFVEAGAAIHGQILYVKREEK